MKLARCMEALTVYEPLVKVLKEEVLSLNCTEATFFDIAGGSGHVCRKLSKHLPLTNTYQIPDLYPPHFPPSLPPPHPSPFTRHDFFHPQSPSPNTLCFYLRWCLHNCPRALVLTILRALLLAMERDPRIVLLIDEAVLP
ncbi:hypothetical protein EX30DRAFT_227635 [Ascodesmis nigricans]|uniref:O-methyltransferase domain-containing protein n=1 Tax=Ascodesmis nigricans TaxID=341454 RepID=A0A4S2MQU6_9PEZI|nr:hypothetical protein EX30DRAFT_227635 [Ascodesmis nigricans]